MTITVDIGDANLSELLAKVEAGEDVILLRDSVPVARMAPVLADSDKRKKAVEDLIAFRAKMPNITQEEIAEWKTTGRR